MALLAAALALTPLLAGTAAAAPRDGDGPLASAARAPYKHKLLAEINRVRAKHGLRPVRLDKRMSRSAKAHSRWMARRGYVTHGSWSDRVARAARANAVGEVLAWMKRTRPRREARTAVRGWLGSGSHRGVMLDGGFRRVGIGRAAGKHRAAYYTVDWASRR